MTNEQIRVMADRLAVLARAVADNQWSEFTMRVPAEPDRDADLVLANAAIFLRDLANARGNPSVLSDIPVLDALLNADDFIARINGNDRDGLSGAVPKIQELIVSAQTVDRVDRGLQGWHADAMPEAMQKLRSALAALSK